MCAQEILTDASARASQLEGAQVPRIRRSGLPLDPAGQRRVAGESSRVFTVDVAAHLVVCFLCSVCKRSQRLPHRDLQHEACRGASVPRLVGLYAHRGGGLPSPRRRYVSLEQPLFATRFLTRVPTELLASLIIMRYIEQYNL